MAGPRSGRRARQTAPDDLALQDGRIGAEQKEALNADPVLHHFVGHDLSSLNSGNPLSILTDWKLF